MFLDDLSQRADLAVQMQIQLQKGIVSSALTTMSYDLTIDTTPLEDPPGAPGTVCKAENGFTVSTGRVLFRINGWRCHRPSPAGNNIFALQSAGMDTQAMINNAQACTTGSGGGTLDFDDFLSMDNTDSLPSCMFNVRVKTTAL